MKKDIEGEILMESQKIIFETIFSEIKNGTTPEVVFIHSTDYYDFIEFGLKILFNEKRYDELAYLKVCKQKLIDSVVSTPDEFVAKYKEQIKSNTTIASKFDQLDEVTLSYMSHGIQSNYLIADTLLSRLSEHPLKKYYNLEHPHEVIHKLLLLTYKILKIENNQ